MKRKPSSYCFFYSLFFLNLFASGVSPQTKTNIAVSDLAGQGVDASSAAVITDRLRSELFNTGTVSVLERSQMQDILKEQGFQQAGCTSDQCAVETGQMLGVKYMVVGSIGLVGHTYTIACRLIDVSTGKMVATANVDCKCEIDDILSRSTVEISRKLVQSFSTMQNNIFTKPAAVPSPKPPAIETGSLKIASSPAGASLFINDSSKGATPLNLDSIKSGRYRLRLELQGYSTITDNVRVTAGSTEEKNYTLKTLPVTHPQIETGSLKIASSPAGASLFINDSSKGATPLNLDSLKSGRYRLRLELQGYNPITDNVRVTAGSTEEKNYTFKTLPVSHPQAENGKKHSSAWPKIALGAGTIVAAGAGFLLDVLVKSEVNKCSDISVQYANSGSNAAYATYRQDYISHYNNEKSFALYRNILYGAAGVLTAGFAISFAF
jgi:TolB-like protein